MSSYTAVSGDTFESVSRKTLGTESGTSKIRKANPSLTEPLSAGDIVYIPEEPRQRNINESSDKVTLLIDGKEFVNFLEISISLSFNSFDTCSIVAPFEPDNTAFREVFRPFSYFDVEIYIGSEIIFSGTQMGIEPSVTPDSKTVRLDAYARCAVINDSCVPISAYPVELRDFNLTDIAKNITSYFNFSVTSEVDVGDTFETVSIEHSKKIATFLNDLSKQRDVVFTNSSDGNLLITKAQETESIAQLQDNLPPVISVSPSFNQQNYFSDYTAILPIIIGLDIASYTAKNSKLSNIMRVDNYMASDASNGEEKLVAESRRSRGLANSISYNVELATIRDPQGALYRPNQNINLLAPTAMIYSDYQFFIRNVSMQLTPNSKTCALDLVLPEAYNGENVEVFPWEE